MAEFFLPIRKSEVISCISLMRSVPRFFTFSKSSFMEKERSMSVSFWGWIWVICSGFSFSATSRLRLVTGLFLSMLMLPRGFSSAVTAHFLFFRDSRSSQRADLDSPGLRKFCEGAQGASV
ncbi:hypothetical protein EYF80_042121 [Liparis tanakae]|uniref:Uncharacterized protein n=1 Tax=Liparis tanakae TaxID=230148 RepID=A0A4Z2G288_9TELE|nr:hypothetical protein EYF80_042121 [Liparis tanakae]